MPEKQSGVITFLKIVFFGVVVYFPLFLHLENLPLRQWDESRLAVSAYEMYKNGNYLVPHFQGNPDMWSVKPPLMIWLQVLGIHLFGANELAIRLPAALAALFTCIGILFFASRFLKSYWLGMLSVLVLVTSAGYVDVHVTRTGDYDSLLTLHMTLYTLFFFVYTETKQTAFLYLTVAFIILAALTKGIAGLLFLPALFLYAVFKRHFLSLLKNPHLYLGLFLFLLFIAGYYLLREQFNPGYIDTVRANEWGGRYLQTLEGHKHPYWFYFFNLTGERFSPWYLLAPAGLLFGLFHKEERVRNFTFYSGLNVVLFFFTISSAQTRITWYDAPLFPFLSLLVAVFLWFWFDFFTTNQMLQLRLRRNILPAAFLFLVFITPYSTILSNVYKPVEHEWVIERHLMSFLQKGLQEKKDFNNYVVCCVDSRTPAIFYLNVMRQRGMNIAFADSDNLHEGQIAVAYQHEIKREIQRRYESVVLSDKNGVKVYRIKMVHECKE